MVARGHLLIEDLPGLGKTTLAQALARVTGLDYKRVQFTSDMLPADLTGFSMFDKESGKFQFQEGPIFCQFLLADEINRCSPKTQSALLEAMEERQVSVDGESRKLPEPFFVIATQNPHSLAGTFPLPESQLDRFLMRISLGYPDATAEREILEGRNPRENISEIEQVLLSEHLLALQTAVSQVKTSDVVMDYVQRLIKATRESGLFVHGISPRGGLALMQAAKAWAMLEGRDYLSPDDVQAVVAPVFSHRLNSRSSGSQTSVVEIEQWIETIDILAS
tara:strand:- start:117 stop:950 length:834 start_codon:yes stop_codon:yes gene_type:complete